MYNLFFDCEKMRTLSNGILELEVSEHGAEIHSLRKVSSNKEYIWNAHPDYWDKHAPILFPFIGRPGKQGIVCNGTAYPMTKHGFVPNLCFCCEEGDRTLTLTASDNEETRKLFPFSFRLEIIYQLSRNKVIQKFRVHNTGNEQLMPFHIGGHPAFSLPNFKESDSVHGYLSFNDIDCLHSNEINPNGHYTEKILMMELDEKGMLPLKKHTFDCDTILETRGIIHRTSLYDKERKPILTVLANSKTIAYWSPNDKEAPFVCIEPWFGCCPKENETEVLQDQKMVNQLQPGEIFEAEMEIIIE